MKPADFIKLIFMMIYSVGVTGASFWYFFKITFDKIPEDNVQNSNLILGFLIGSAISTFLGYYFGMSQSVRRDDKQPPPTEFTQTVTRTESGADPKAT
jgi:hypothetical protein